MAYTGDAHAIVHLLSTSTSKHSKGSPLVELVLCKLFSNLLRKPCHRADRTQSKSWPESIKPKFRLISKDGTLKDGVYEENSYKD